jgi:hypothetical protein
VNRKDKPLTSMTSHDTVNNFKNVQKKQYQKLAVGVGAYRICISHQIS